MAKKFFTDTDIEELHRKGIKSLKMNDDVVLTDLAYEKAKRLDIQLVYDRADTPPAAPVRPYLSDKEPQRSKPQPDSVPSNTSQPKPTQPNDGEIESRIRSAVLAKLGNQVDAKLLENIIHRVVKATGLK